MRRKRDAPHLERDKWVKHIRQLHILSFVSAVISIAPPRTFFTRNFVFLHASFEYNASSSRGRYGHRPPHTYGVGVGLFAPVSPVPFQLQLSAENLHGKLELGPPAPNSSFLSTFSAESWSWARPSPFREPVRVVRDITEHPLYWAFLLATTDNLLMSSDNLRDPVAASPDWVGGCGGGDMGTNVLSPCRCEGTN